jgi:hypothetical protein
MIREGVLGLAIVGMIVAAIGILATALGQSDFGVGLVMLAYYLAVIIVVRPLVYERFGAHVGEWVVVILILGPATLFFAPFLWWEHRHADVDAGGQPTTTG